MSKQPYLSISKNSYKRPDMKDPDLRGFITLHEPLPAGNYDIGLYEGISKKGNKKYSGIIKPKVEKIMDHWQERYE